MSTTAGSRLLVLNRRQSLEVPFSQQLTIGRDVLNALSLNDHEVSRSHAIVYYADAGRDVPPRLFVKDLNSLNGIFVNGRPENEAALEAGDELIIGSTILLVAPGPDRDFEDCLSDKGKTIFRKIRKPKPFQETEIASFTVEEMDASAEASFANLEDSAIWAPAHAATFLRTFGEMSRAENAAQYFAALLRGAGRLAGAEQGAIMLRDSEDSALTIRAVFSSRSENNIVITQVVNRIAIKGGRAFFSPDCGADERFAEQKVSRADDRPKTLLALPLGDAAQPVGFLYLDSLDPNASFSAWDLRRVWMLARPGAAFARALGRM